jgi:hypothetical protein
VINRYSIITNQGTTPLFSRVITKPATERHGDEGRIAACRKHISQCFISKVRINNFRVHTGLFSNLRISSWPDAFHAITALNEKPQRLFPSGSSVLGNGSQVSVSCLAPRKIFEKNPEGAE